LQFIIA